MKLAIQLSVVIVAIITLSCNPNKIYEAEIIDQAQTIKNKPVSRIQLIEVFGLKDDESKVSTKTFIEQNNYHSFKGSREVWMLSNSYQLVAIDDTDLKVSSESKRKAEAWRKTVGGRDYFVLEFDPIKSFDEFILLSPHGDQIYPLKGSTSRGWQSASRAVVRKLNESFNP